MNPPSSLNTPTDYLDDPRETRPPQVTRLGLWWVAAGGLVAAMGALLVRQVHLFAGIVALTLLIAAGMRQWRQPGQVGGLVVRGRTFDVVVLVLLAVIVGVTAAVLNLNPAGAP